MVLAPRKADKTHLAHKGDALCFSITVIWGRVVFFFLSDNCKNISVVKILSKVQKLSYNNIFLNIYSKREKQAAIYTYVYTEFICNRLVIERNSLKSLPKLDELAGLFKS